MMVNKLSPPRARTPAWLDSRLLFVLLLAASLAPMLVVDIPPLTDLPGHMGRYRVELGLAASPALQAFYSFHWALIGNLGVDLLVVPLAPLLGLEGAVKLIVAAIPVLTAAGFLLVARAAHGRTPPTAVFALPLAYGHPFQWGFVNFALSAALAVLALALWLELAKRGRTTLRAMLFVPIGLVLWITHVAGWAMLALLAGATELFRWRRAGAGWVRSLVHAGANGLALAPPLLLMLLWRSEAAGSSFNWFNWTRKAEWATMTLRDRWQAWDVVCVDLLAALVLIVLPLRLFLLWRAGRDDRESAIEFGLGFDPGLALGAGLLLLAFLLLPGTVFGSAYADMRLAPFALAAALLAIRPDAWGRGARWVALAALAFFVARTAGTTISFARHDRAWRAELAAIDRLPPGARLVTFVSQICPIGWSTPRFDHLASVALVRRGAFANDQWTMPGAQLLGVRYRAAAPFVEDPSQFVASGNCRVQARLTLDQALARVPRAAFDYVWLINPPGYDAQSTRGLMPVWRGGTSVLYRVIR